MKHLLYVFATILLLGINMASAQTTKSGTGARNPDDLKKEVEIFLEADSYVASLGGAATVVVTTGKGILTAFELQAINSTGGTTSTPYGLEIFDASTSAEAAIFGTKKIIADQIGGGQVNSLAGVRNNTFRHPVRFNNGIVVKMPSGATNGSWSVNWKK